MNRHLTAGFVLAVLVLAPCAARAQDAAEPPVVIEVNPADAPPGATDDLSDVLDNLTPEQIEQLVAEAMASRLQVEREQVIAEIRAGLLYDPKDVAAAVRIVQADPTDAQADNIQRIMRAFATVDPRFGQAYKLSAEGKHAEAAAAAEQLVDPRQTSCAGAARHWLYAEALRQADRGYDAIDVYRAVLVNMPDRISFASASAAAAARTYEQLDRGLYAMQMYEYCLKNYGLTLSKAEFDAMAAKLEELAGIYGKPMDTLVQWMGRVSKRLEAEDSGRETQKTEQEIVALLEDLIKTAEEQQGGGSSGSGQQGQQGQQGQKQGQGQGQGQGQAQGQGKSGPPSGTRQPSSPAQRSALVPGGVERPTELSKIRDTGESGDWAELPPRERLRIEQLRKRAMSERHKDIITDYRSRLAGGDGR